MTRSFLIGSLQVGDLIILPRGGAEPLRVSGIGRSVKPRKMRKLLRSLVALNKQRRDKR